VENLTAIVLAPQQSAMLYPYLHTKNSPTITIETGDKPLFAHKHFESGGASAQLQWAFDLELAPWHEFYFGTGHSGQWV
ncbi:unnamed protein product, partial [Timema podura]|nr:unnamed protein product [Timema podura]